MPGRGLRPARTRRSFRATQATCSLGRVRGHRDIGRAPLRPPHRSGLGIGGGGVNMASRAELARLDDALVRIVATNRPITVRGVFYRAVAEGLVPKDETKGYRVVQRRLVKLRAEGDVPYGWITDGSRTIHGHIRYRDADEFARSVKFRYRQDYWRDAEEYVEVWVEKEAMVGVLKPVVIDEFGLDLYVTRGFSSVTYLQEAAQDI